MAKGYKFLILLALSIIPSIAIHAQLTGVINVPSTTYPTLASAITALNVQGVGSGGATINLVAGNAQTAPAGGYQLGSTILNASTSATNKLVITGNGNVITAPTGTSTTVDGIFLIKGVDYLTIDSLNLAESSGNTTGTTAMEWGYALVNLNAAAPFDGCQNDTIRRCTVTLNRSVVIPSVGIYSGHHTSASTAALTITTAADLHSNNAYLSNKITNVFRGIALIGYSLAASPTLFDQNTSIGGNSPATGNTITNCFGTNYTPGAGILCQYTTNANINYNTIDNLADGGVNLYGGFGIYAYGASATFTINNNNVTLGANLLSTATYVYGIYCNSLSTNVTAQNNNITITEIAGSAAGNCLALFTPNGNNNTLNNNTIIESQAVNSTTYGIYSTATGAVLLNGNSIKQTTSGTAATTCQFYSIALAGVAASETVTNNIFNGTNVGSASYFGYSMLIYDVNSTGTKTITGNKVIGGYTHNSSTPFYGIYNANSVVSNSGTATIANNNFSGFTINGAGGMYMLYIAPTVNGPQNYSINTDTFSNITTAINTPFYGIYVQGAANSDVYANQISDITTGGALYAMYVAGNTTNNIYRNKLYNLSSTSTSGIVNGLVILGGTTNTIYNNILGSFSASSASSTVDAIRGISLQSVAAGSTHKLYYNTIYLNATSSGANFSTSALYHTTSSTSTSGTLDLRNNIIINFSTPVGSGTTAAFRRSSSGGANYAATSDRNIFYGGAPSATRLIMTDGTNSYQTLATYKAAVTPADANSFTENSPFASITGSSPNFLHFAPFSFTYAESSGANVTGFTNDYDLDVRQGNTGYTGNGTAPDIGADEFNNCSTISITTQPVNDTACSASSAHFNVVASPTSGFYQWQVNTGSGFADITNGGVYSGALTANLVVTNPPASMNGYTYRVKVMAGPTCPQTTSNTVSLAVTPSPSSAVTISGPTTFCEGDSVILTVPAAGNLTYVWKVNGNTITGATTNSYKAFNSGSYTVTVSSTNGCSSTSTPVNVISNPAPTTYVTYNSPLEFCQGGAIVLNAFPYTGVTYQWYRDGSSIPGATTGYHVADQTGAYRVKVTNSLNCTNLSTAIPVLVHPTPQPVITLQGDTLSAQPGYVSYQWKFGNSYIPGADRSRYTVTEMGSYSVTVVDSFGCTNTSAAYFISGLGTANVAQVASMIFSYPSPATSFITVENKSKAKLVFVNIINSLGQVVYGVAPSGDKHSIALEGIASGIYTLRIQTNAGVVNRRIEIVR